MLIAAVNHCRSKPPVLSAQNPADAAHFLHKTGRETQAEQYEDALVVRLFPQDIKESGKDGDGVRRLHKSKGIPSQAAFIL